MDRGGVESFPPDGVFPSCTCQLSEDAAVASLPSFEVTPNAVLVNEASPVALAEAVLHLILRPELRAELSSSGVETVHRHFSSDRQIWQYSQLYRQLYESYKSAEVKKT
jgi:glycosyltransferase involved in cell wall biosynthesis